MPGFVRREVLFHIVRLKVMAEDVRVNEYSDPSPAPSLQLCEHLVFNLYLMTITWARPNDEAKTYVHKLNAFIGRRNSRVGSENKKIFI